MKIFSPTLVDTLEDILKVDTNFIRIYLSNARGNVSFLHILLRKDHRADTTRSQ